MRRTVLDAPLGAAVGITAGPSSRVGDWVARAEDVAVWVTMGMFAESSTRGGPARGGGAGIGLRTTGV